MMVTSLLIALTQASLHQNNPLKLNSTWKYQEA